jgi:hypothetical protein
LISLGCPSTFASPMITSLVITAVVLVWVRTLALMQVPVWFPRVLAVASAVLIHVLSPCINLSLPAVLLTVLAI